ncbi:MAG: hypothetical protein M3Z23_13580 [Acidobacteriota bacterium]|nr:hypothetical protein [Acidobacteriota bacterium]
MTAEEKKRDLIQLVQALRPIARLLSHQREFELDEEELSPECQRRLDAAHQSLDQGEGIPHAEVLREFGL